METIGRFLFGFFAALLFGAIIVGAFVGLIALGIWAFGDYGPLVTLALPICVFFGVLAAIR